MFLIIEHKTPKGKIFALFRDGNLILATGEVLCNIDLSDCLDCLRVFWVVEFEVFDNFCCDQAMVLGKAKFGKLFAHLAFKLGFSLGRD